jgi:hypothetical protein
MPESRRLCAMFDGGGILQAFRDARAPVSHAWLLDLFYAGSPAVTWAAAKELPAGFERAGQFAVLPGRADRIFLVSLATRPGAASALTSFNSLRSGRTRLARRVLGLGLRAGIAQPLLRDKIDIGIEPGASPAQLADELLGQHLQDLFGRGPVVIALGAGSGPYRKPVLQVFAADGVPLGYIKVGWNDWTREAVGREATALRACAQRPMRFGVPELLGLSTWRGLDLLVTAPLPDGVRRLGSAGGLPEAAVLREISELAPDFADELAASPWWRSLRTRIQAVTDPAARSALELTAERIERSYGRVPLSFGAWHGDLVPWNLARVGSRLYAWDWESSTPDVPLGFDAVHFYFQVAFVAEGRPLGESVALAAGQSGPALGELGVPAPARRLVVLLHLVEQAVRHEEARRSTGDIDGRFYPAVMGVLERELAGLRTATGPRSAGRAA